MRWKRRYKCVHPEEGYVADEIRVGEGWGSGEPAAQAKLATVVRFYLGGDVPMQCNASIN